MKNKVLIIGRGELGKALGFVLGQNKENEISFWERGKKDKGKQAPLVDLVAQSSFVFLAVPTIALEGLIKEIVPSVKNNQSLVVLSKGLSKEGLTPVNLTRRTFSGSVLNLSGPMLAEELLTGKQTQALVAGSREGALGHLLPLFVGTNLEVEKWDDLIGLSWAGPLKNLYAIGMGIVDKIDNSSNRRGCFVTQAVFEMADLFERFGGRRKTAYSVAGIGDLLATGLSQYSSNFQFGRNLAEGKISKRVPEGISVALGLKKRLGNELSQRSLTCSIVNKIINSLREEK